MSNTVKERKRVIANLEQQIAHKAQWLNRLSAFRKRILGNASIRQAALDAMLPVLTHGKGDQHWYNSLQVPNAIREVDDRYALQALKDAPELKGWDGRGVETLRAELELDRERLEALRASLPTPEQLADAERRIAAYTADLERLDGAMASRMETILVNLREAERLASELLAGRQEQDSLLRQIARLVEAFDVSGRTHVWKPEEDERKEARLLGLVVADVAFNVEPSEYAGGLGKLWRGEPVTVMAHARR
jgi:hypothetical protein